MDQNARRKRLVLKASLGLRVKNSPNLQYLGTPMAKAKEVNGKNGEFHQKILLSASIWRHERVRRLKFSIPRAKRNLSATLR